MKNIKELEEEIKYYIQYGISDGMLKDSNIFNDVIKDILTICLLNKHLIKKDKIVKLDLPIIKQRVGVNEKSKIDKLLSSAKK